MYFSDNDPYAYQVTNLVIHILVAFVLYGLLRGTLSLPKVSRSVRSNAAELALATAFLWVIHPLTPIAVTYTIQRAESLMALLYLFTLYAAYRAAFSKQKLLWQCLAVLSCLLGMASKEVMVSAPLIVYLYDAIFLSGSFSKPMERRPKFYVCLFLTWLLVFYLAYVTGGRDGTAGFNNIYDIGWWDYMQTQCFAIANFLY